MAAHLYWRINCSANEGDATFLSIAEVEMFAALAGGTDLCTGGTASASTADAAGPSPASNAFDNNTTTRWATTSGTTTGWLRYQFGSAVDVFRYSIRTHPTTALRAPKNFTFEYSDDGSGWTVAQTVTNQTAWGTGATRTFYLGDAEIVSKLTAFAVRSGSTTGVSVAKLNAYCIFDSSIIAGTTVVRPQVFVCT